MKKNKLKLELLLLMILSNLWLNAQQNVVASGGTATGVSGSVTYTVGQLFYSYQTGTSGWIIEGMQQPFEFSGDSVAAPTANAQTLPSGATVANLVATGSNLQWYIATTGGTALATSTVLFTGTYYVSQTVGGVESPRTSVVVTLSNPAIPTSKVKANLCGTTLSSLNANIIADYVAGYQAYRFEVTNGATINTVEVNKYNFSLIQIPGITYSTTYAVRVAVKMGGIWGQYGVSCNVTTPALVVNVIPTTTIKPSLCGTTLSSLDTKIAAVLVYGATKGRFEITIAGGAPVVYEVAGYNFKLSQTGVAVLYNTSYAIRVAAFVGGVWGNYGASCTVTTPAAPIARLKTKMFEVSAYPNPFETAFNFNFETPSKSAVTVSVYDMLGRQVENKTIQAEDLATSSIGSNYAAGVYNIIVSQDENTKTLRMVKK